MTTIGTPIVFQTQLSVTRDTTDSTDVTNQTNRTYTPPIRILIACIHIKFIYSLTFYSRSVSHLVDHRYPHIRILPTNQYVVFNPESILSNNVISQNTFRVKSVFIFKVRPKYQLLTLKVFVLITFIRQIL